MSPTQSKERRKTWDKEQMIKAINMVHEKKMDTLKAAKYFKVPRTTLQRLNLKTELKKLYEKNNYSPDRVYNIDETGLTVVQSKIAEVIGRRGKRQIASLTSAERGFLVTVVHTHPTPDSSVILMLDGYFSHTRNTDVIDLARENNVNIVSLPPHTTHVYYSEEIRIWIRNNNSFDIVDLFEDADFLAAEQNDVKDGCTDFTPKNSTRNNEGSSTNNPRFSLTPLTSIHNDENLISNESPELRSRSET
ncbi:hypothetical protein GWI33_012327 [Rhynchophorus ferrugineus]|uniref:HTH psq-type domain-containing protein n=1 Tax=Rhynchophorus ferrugineus TaxID=354439 RepID=A0A834J1D0_RHYFE|nr:hypothetical protein GWI33_012327 [Rhynchophorus ferrugineus]